MDGHDNGGRRASGVNVGLAEAEFAALSRQLSSASQHRSASHQRDEDTDATQNSNGDLEKGNDTVRRENQNEEFEEPFDLEAMLRGAKNEDEEAGIKSKRIGVLWEGLTVSGFGGTKVCTYDGFLVF